MLSDCLLSASFLPLSIVLLGLGLGLVSSLVAHREHGHAPSGVPWVGKRREFLGSIKANWRGLVDSVPLFLDGYRKVISLRSRRAARTDNFVVFDGRPRLYRTHLAAGPADHPATFHGILAGTDAQRSPECSELHILHEWVPQCPFAQVII